MVKIDLDLLQSRLRLPLLRLRGRQLALCYFDQGSCQLDILFRGIDLSVIGCYLCLGSVVIRFGRIEILLRDDLLG